MASWDVYVEHAKDVLSNEQYAHLLEELNRSEGEVRAIDGTNPVNWFYVAHNSYDRMKDSFDRVVELYPQLSVHARADNGVPFQVQAGNRSTWKGESNLLEHSPSQ